MEVGVKHALVVDHDIGWAEESVGEEGKPRERIVRIPKTGRAWDELKEDLLARKCDDFDWRSGRIPIYVYFDNEQLLSVARDAYNLYFVENALGQRAFPSLARLEREVIDMALALFRAPQGGVGSFTSGGTESIFLGIKAARDRFRASRNLTVKPNIVIARTAHPAFDKAASYLDLDVVRVDVAPDLRCDPRKLEAAVNDRTMLIAGSAPCYPYGIFDDITQLGQIAMARDLWLHVDACLGGFLAPFARDEGYDIPSFDLSVPGVCSLSADLHKFGYSARGASVVLYRSRTLKSYQAFHFDNWPRGTYSTETFPGSRPGGAIASAWAVMQYLGEAGYRQLARKIMDAAQRLRVGIERIEGLALVGSSDLNIVVYRSADPSLDIYAVGDVLQEMGWFVGRMREPAALHLALNAVHAPVVSRYLQDLRVAVADARLSGKSATHDDVTY